MSNWYPQWVYDKREDITRENMKWYDGKRNAYLDEIEEKETELGRKLTMAEKYNLREKYGL